MAVTKLVSGYTPLLQLCDEVLPDGVGPDDRSGACYLADGPMQLATEIALTTGRPLLLRGRPGSGKSSWAPYVARNLGWSYHEVTITADKEAESLFYEFDAVKRLQDAQLGPQGGDLEAWRYVNPGPMWWAFDFRGASEHIRRQDSDRSLAALPQWEANQSRDVGRAVVMVDELDKADPALPNDLLEMTSLQHFHIARLQRSVQWRKPTAVDGWTPAGTCVSPAFSRVNELCGLLMVFTTNEERDLPDAFLRRCVVHRLADPDEQQLEEIAWLHRNTNLAKVTKAAPTDDGQQNSVVRVVQLFARATVAVRMRLRALGQNGPSTAEFLDLVRAWEALEMNADSESIKTAFLSILNKLADDRLDVDAILDEARAKP